MPREAKGALSYTSRVPNMTKVVAVRLGSVMMLSTCKLCDSVSFIIVPTYLLSSGLYKNMFLSKRLIMIGGDP